MKQTDGAVSSFPALSVRSQLSRCSSAGCSCSPERSGPGGEDRPVRTHGETCHSWWPGASPCPNSGTWGVLACLSGTPQGFHHEDGGSASLKPTWTSLWGPPPHAVPAQVVSSFHPLTAQGEHVT